MDIVRIAESYFNDLLQLPPKKAVTQIRSEWRRRETLGGSESLSEPEVLVDRLCRFAFLVSVGGHWYFFQHVSRADAVRTIAALRIVGLDDVAALLGDALTICDPYPPLTARTTALRRAQLVSDDVRFSKLDRAVWRAPIYEAFLVYLRAHADEVLRPERGLDK